MKRKFKEIQQDDEFKASLAVALASTFMLLFFAPLELYLNNKQEFWFDFFTLSPVLIGMFVVGISLNIVAMFLLFITNIYLYRIALVTEFVVFMILYVQGNILVKRLPALDGTPIQWEKYSGEQVKSTILVIAITIIMLFLWRYFKMRKLINIIKVVSIFFTLVLLVTVISLFFIQKGSERKISAMVKTENQLTMSTDTNYIIFLIDAVDAGAVSKIFEETPEKTEIFEDFTYYPNTMGAYSLTQETIPFLFSGEWYENKEPFQDYNVRAYKESEFFRQLEDDGFRLNVYESDMPLLDESVFRFDNVGTSTEINSKIDFAKMLIRLVGFKYLPYGIKQYSMANIPQFNIMKEFNSLRYSSESECSLFFGSNLKMYNKIMEEEISISEQKEFKFIHVEGAHVPFIYDEEMKVIDEKKGSYEKSVRASLTLVEHYLDKLKESNVYNNSSIIIMSDHGYVKEEGSEQIQRQNPAFFVKGLQEKHSLNISNAPISYADLRDAFMKLKEGKASDELFEWSEGDIRERRYLRYPYLKEEHMTEYIQTGEAGDVSTMYKSGREFNQ